ncbi:MAG: glycosyltransferase family 2 protein [Xanthomonadales bacterium]|jgi:hypothetical protein|nr:glycosyltransferase family 2 protein [Xanthomonadales bacterium]
MASLAARLRQAPGLLARRLDWRVKEPVHMLQRRLQAWKHGRDLRGAQDRTDRIRAGDVLLFCCLRNEAIRIPAFLDYYRRLGVAHFLFVDNGSGDGFLADMTAEEDVSVWTTTSSYREANYGMHWLNHLLARFGRDHWCVTCDPDEFLVFPHCDRRDLVELGAFLDGERQRSLNCLMLDMYSAVPVEEAGYAAGQDPLEVSNRFDPLGYSQVDGLLRDIYTRGGVRRRVFFHDVPEQAPALNKTPFVKWRWSYSYFTSMHQLVPCWLNHPHEPERNHTTGVLLHFKYFGLLRDKAAEEMNRGEHWNDSFEYRRYHDSLERESLHLDHPGGATFQGWRQLVDLGLMNLGRWF